MTLPPIPINRYLVPVEPPPLPPGSEIVDHALLNGLPHELALGAGATALLIAPSGVAITWRDADPTVVISAGGDSFRPNDPAQAALDPLTRPPARLLVRRSDGSLLGALPLVAQVPFALPLGEAETGPGLELILLFWDVRAGNLRGPGDFGGRIRLAWRRIDQAAASFAPRPPHPLLAFRPAPPEAPKAPEAPVPGPVHAVNPPRRARNVFQIEPHHLMVSRVDPGEDVWLERRVQGFIP